MSRGWLLSVLGCGTLAVLGAQMAMAQAAATPPAATPPAAAPTTPTPGATQAMPVPARAVAAPAGAPGGEDAPPWPKFEEVTKGMESYPGLFTLWSYPASAKDKDTERLLCQIPAGFLGQKFMLSTSMAGGGYYTGFPVDEHVVTWELQDRQLVLVEPESRFVTDAKGTISDVVKRTYPDRIRAAVPLVTKAGADPVIDLSNLLKGTLADAGEMGRGGVNPSLSKWVKKKVFDLNIEIGVELAIARPSPAGSYDKRILHFSFWKLPGSDYKPRIADDRVGYFLTANQDWAKPSESRDLFNRYIDRWNLVKRDPSLAKCEVREPIVYYVEKTVPVRFRKAVRDGVLEWNKAFDKLGFVDAVQVRQQTEDNEWKDLDPEDMRYSFIRWIVTGDAFAMGPHRSNPFTGQIYDADIIFDDSMVRSYQQDAGEMMPAGLAAQKWRDPAMQQFVKMYPQWLRPDHPWETLKVGEDRPDLDAVMSARAIQRGFFHCDYARGMMHQLLTAQAVLADQPPEVTDRLLYDTIKQVVTHEVGHTLGLRHNFKGSSIYSLDEIKRRRKTDEPTCGSVMDYIPVLYFNDNMTEGHFTTPTLGPYDYWAIEYGYRPADGTYKPTTQPAGDEAAAKKRPPVSSEEGMLMAIAWRAYEPELAYATDEDCTSLSPDPRCNRFDHSSDPVAWAKERMAVIDKRMSNLLEWAAKDGESWYFVRASFTHLIAEKAQVLDYVGRYVGGQYTSRSHRGDPHGKAPFELVDIKTQRDAMDFVEQTLFNDSFFAVPPTVLNHLGVPRWYHEDASVNLTMDFPVHTMISTLQWSYLTDRLFPNTLRRIHDAEMKSVDGNKLTVAEYLQRLQKACWGDSLNPARRSAGKWSNEQPFISDVRRSLQREYLGQIEPMVRMQPGDVVSPDIHGMLQYLLIDLSKQIGDVLKDADPPLDFASLAHLTTCKSRIDRILSAPLEENGRSSMMFMLSGQQAGKATQPTAPAKPTGAQE